jgi:hypothetical protein
MLAKVNVVYTSNDNENGPPPHPTKAPYSISPSLFSLTLIPISFLSSFSFIASDTLYRMNNGIEWGQKGDRTITREVLSIELTC